MIPLCLASSQIKFDKNSALGFCTWVPFWCWPSAPFDTLFLHFHSTSGNQPLLFLAPKCEVMVLSVKQHLQLLAVQQIDSVMDCGAEKMPCWQPFTSYRPDQLFPRFSGYFEGDSVIITSTVHLKLHPILCIVFSHASFTTSMNLCYPPWQLHFQYLLRNIARSFPRIWIPNYLPFLPVEHCSLSSSGFQSQCCDNVKTIV